MLHSGYGLALALELRLAPEAILRAGETYGAPRFLQFIWEGAGAAAALCTHRSLAEAKAQLAQFGPAAPGSVGDFDIHGLLPGLPPSLRPQASHGYGRMSFRLTGELNPAGSTVPHPSGLDFSAARRGAALEYLFEHGPGYPQLLQDPANDDGTEAWHDALANLFAVDAWCFPTDDFEAAGTADTASIRETRARALRYYQRGWPPPVQFGRRLR